MLFQLVPFEVLHCPFMLFCRHAGLEGPQVSTFPWLRILFSRVEAILRGELPNHFRFVIGLRIRPNWSVIKGS